MRQVSSIGTPVAYKDASTETERGVCAAEHRIRPTQLFSSSVFRAGFCVTSHSPPPEGFYHLVCPHQLGELEKEVSDLKMPLRDGSYKNLSVTEFANTQC